VTTKRKKQEKLEAAPTEAEFEEIPENLDDEGSCDDFSESQEDEIELLNQEDDEDLINNLMFIYDNLKKYPKGTSDRRQLVHLLHCSVFSFHDEDKYSN
jgi:hypothetical protein